MQELQALKWEVAARSAGVIVLTVPWAAAREVIAMLGDLQGRVLLDCTNPVSEWPKVEHGPGKSGGEQGAAWSAKSRVMKIFNTTGYKNMVNPECGGEGLTMLYAGETILTQSK